MELYEVDMEFMFDLWWVRHGSEPRLSTRKAFLVKMLSSSRWGLYSFRAPVLRKFSERVSAPNVLKRAHARLHELSYSA